MHRSRNKVKYFPARLVKNIPEVFDSNPCRAAGSGILAHAGFVIQSASSSLPLNSDPDVLSMFLGECMNKTARLFLLVMLLSLTAFAQNAQIAAKSDALPNTFLTGKHARFS